MIRFAHILPASSSWSALVKTYCDAAPPNQIKYLNQVYIDCFREAALAMSKAEKIEYITASDTIKLYHPDFSNSGSAGQYHSASMVLAHLLENNSEYYDSYVRNKPADSEYRIMDNSGFEVAEHAERGGRYICNIDKLIELGQDCHATCIVLPDRLREDAKETILRSAISARKIKDAGFETMFVPHCDEPGDIDQYFACLVYAINHPELYDKIGISYIGAEHALNATRSAEKIMARQSILKAIDQYYYLANNYAMDFRKSIHQDNPDFIDPVPSGLHPSTVLNDKFHFLGLPDGPNEIELINNNPRLSKMVFSWDSSLAFQAGVQGITLSKDLTPTSLSGGKASLDKPDFSMQCSEAQCTTINNNIEHIYKLCHPEFWNLPADPDDVVATGGPLYFYDNDVLRAAPTPLCGHSPISINSTIYKNFESFHYFIYEWQNSGRAIPLHDINDAACTELIEAFFGQDDQETREIQMHVFQMDREFEHNEHNAIKKVIDYITKTYNNPDQTKSGYTSSELDLLQSIHLMLKMMNKR